MSSHISDESPLSRGENESLCAVGPLALIGMPSASLFCILEKREWRGLIARKVLKTNFFFPVDRNVGYFEGTV